MVVKRSGAILAVLVLVVGALLLGGSTRDEVSGKAARSRPSAAATLRAGRCVPRAGVVPIGYCDGQPFSVIGY